MAYNLLKGKKGIIFGALNEQSIAWKVAQRAVEEGAGTEWARELLSVDQPKGILRRQVSTDYQNIPSLDCGRS